MEESEKYLAKRIKERKRKGVNLGVLFTSFSLLNS
jgi:hypothetical protein